MSLTNRKPVQSSLPLRYKQLVRVFMRLHDIQTESDGISSIIEKYFDELPLADRLMYKRIILRDYPESKNEFLCYKHEKIPPFLMGLPPDEIKS